MKFEQFNKDFPIDATIKEIKKAELDSKVKIAAEKFGTEAIAEAMKDEVSTVGNREYDREKTIETETLVEEMELNPETKGEKEAKEKLFEYLERIDQVGKKYSTVYEYFEVFGSNGRSYNKEFDDFLEKRKDDPDYCPTFEYPGVDKIDLDKVDADKEAIIEIKNDLDEEESSELKIICKRIIESIENNIALLESVKERDFESAFKYATQVYGDIDDELVRRAEGVYEDKIKEGNKTELRSEKENEIEAKLKSTVFEPEDFKNYFEILIKKAGFEKDGWEVIITPEVQALDIRSASKDYDHPVVLVPQKRTEESDGLKFIKLLNHEFTHIITQTYNKRNGFRGMSIGPAYETFTEGIAKISETEIEKEIFERPESDNAFDAHPYYVLGMKKVKDGANFPQTLDYLVELYKKELEQEGTNKDKIADMAIKKMKAICRRIFRGFDPKEGGKYFPKDKAYLQGEIGARKMKEEGVVDYLYELKVDPEMIPYLNKLGAFARKEGLQSAKEVVARMWKDKGWPMDLILNRKWYQENTQMDRHWAYRKEFGDKFEDDN